MHLIDSVTRNDDMTDVADEPEEDPAMLALKREDLIVKQRQDTRLANRSQFLAERILLVDECLAAANVLIYGYKECLLKGFSGNDLFSRRSKLTDQVNSYIFISQLDKMLFLCSGYRNDHVFHKIDGCFSSSWVLCNCWENARCEFDWRHDWIFCVGDCEC